jgi:hypothetical protein
MIDLIFDLYQQRRINEVEATAQASSRKSTDFQARGSRTGRFRGASRPD